MRNSGKTLARLTKNYANLKNIPSDISDEIVKLTPYRDLMLAELTANKVEVVDENDMLQIS